MKQYIEKNKDRFFEELFSLLRIPSVSSAPEHKKDMARCAARWVELLLEAGADNAAVYPTEGHPVVFGEKKFSPDAPTMPPTATSSRSPIARPAIAPATPLRELSREMVMGISAPPTLREKSSPNADEAMSSTANAQGADSGPIMT